MKAFKQASQFVQDMKRKHGANPIWVWDLLEDEFNIIKGLGCIVLPEEMAHIESLVIEGLK